jgi:RNA polymerase sigma-70 factor (ECF subfamily)
VSGDDDFEAALLEYVGAARKAWPDLDVDTETLIRHVGGRTPPGKPPTAAHAGDMLLACACARGDPAAIDAFHRHYGVVIARVLSRRRATPDVVDDAVQAVYERLLVRSASDPPEIADYKGVGSLRGWVSTVTARTLLMMRRSKGRRGEQSGSGLVAALATKVDPELLYARERYKSDMEGAIETVLGRLGDRERTLLRLHLGERMSIDKLAVMYKVNRATAARWLALAKDAVVTMTRDELRTRLRLSDRDYDSVVALIQSDFELSIARLLT